MRLEINNTTKQRVDKKLLQKAVDVFGKKMRFSKKLVSVAIIGEKRMKKLNSTYRKIDKVTDVLSFRDSEKDFLGEVIVCYPQIKKQAKQQGIPVKDELVFIFIHGLLHLAGYDDRKQKEHDEMIQIGEKLCKSMV